MLHNSGPYGPNETPVNMGAPLNISQLSTPMNMVQNLNNMSKMPQQSPPAATGHYNLPNYPSYGNPPLNVSPPMHPFQNYHPLGFQPSYMPQNSPMMQNTVWQNAMMPMSLNMHGDHSQNVLNYPHLDKRLSEPVNSYKDINHLAKTPLNIPQLPIKPYQTEPEPLDNVPNTFNDRYKPYIANNEGLNLGVSMKSPEILLSDNTRRKNLENTVRLIENILINTTKNREMQHSMESEQEKSSEKYLHYNDTDVKNSLSREDLRADNSVDDSDEEMDSVPVKFDDNDENEESENNLNESEDESYKSDESIKNKSNDNDNVIVEVPLNPVEKERNDVKELEQTECQESDLKTVIKQEPIELEKQIVVKIEQISSWTDTEHMSPFHRDSNGVLRDDAVHGNIIDSETSEVEALEIIKNGLSSNCYFECPQCSLLFEHPKRFLIHTKWHTFGHDKRAEVITKKEARERKEARKRIKLEGGDEDADVKPAGKGTKVWPCKDCDKVYYAKSSLSGHRQRYHSNRIRECKICSKIVAGWSAWKAHQASHNTDSGFPCNECPKKFKYAHSLAKHKDTHLEKTHACPECPKKFGSQVLLKVHMKSHERAKQGASFHCSFCGKAFYDKFNMQIHERTHTNERPFVCEICNATFGCNSNLSRHLKVSHSSSKPYVCSTCARSFVSELIRDRHELRVHGDPAEFKYTCKQCPSRYMKQVDLRKHTYKMHPKPKSETKTK